MTSYGIVRYLGTRMGGTGPSRRNICDVCFHSFWSSYEFLGVFFFFGILFSWEIATFWHWCSMEERATKKKKGTHFFSRTDS